MVKVKQHNPSRAILLSWVGGGCNSVLRLNYIVPAKPELGLGLSFSSMSCQIQSMIFSFLCTWVSHGHNFFMLRYLLCAHGLTMHMCMWVCHSHIYFIQNRLPPPSKDWINIVLMWVISKKTQYI